MPARFDDRSSARGQPPTRDPSSFAKVAKGGGKDVGGRENTRADFLQKTAERKGFVTGKNPGGPKRFSDKSV